MATEPMRWDDAVWQWIVENVPVGQEFTNQQLRKDDAWFHEVRSVHSDDPNAWVRRSMQTLRDQGLVAFVDRGRYQRLGRDHEHSSMSPSR